MSLNESEELQLATFGGGCFWCIEALFQRIHGVKNVKSGFAAPKIKNFTEEQFKSHESKHAEVIHLQYDPTIISYYHLVWIFMQVHDPTTLNKQGQYEGEEFRSVIVYHNEKQKEEALQAIRSIEEEKIYENQITTELVQYDGFIEAQQDHQNYYNNNIENAYCQANIAPKIKVFFTKFKNFSTEKQG